MDRGKNICVFAGSNLGSELAFAKNAEELGKIIATSKKKLVYGGGRKGLMGVIADSVLAYDGLVTGVITKQLEEIEVGHKNLSELIYLRLPITIIENDENSATALDLIYS